VTGIQRRQKNGWKNMIDFLNLLVMIFAAVAAMLFGVLTSYAMFRIGFWLMNPERKLGFAKSPRESQIKPQVETA
jgi:hypothetical protein